MRDLADRLAEARPEKVLVYVRRAEKLHDQIDAEAAYPIDFLAYRVTGQRQFVDSAEDAALLAGEAVQADLRAMIDQLSWATPLPLTGATAQADAAQADDAVELADELAARWNVSAKTLTRWRKLGLRWRWVTTAAGRRELAFTREATARFELRHADRLRRAASFTHMTPAQRQRLIDRARRLAGARDLSLNQVAQHLARRSGRALETIRQLLEQHDAQHPDHRIFADHTGPLSGRQRRLIARAYRMGVPVRRMAQHFGRTPSTIYRAIQDRRAATLRRLPISFVASRLFERNDADEVILRPPPADASPPQADQRPDVPVDNLPAELRTLYRQPTLSHETQQSLFVRFNYLKFKAARLRDELDRYEPRAGDLDRIEAWLREAAAIRERLVLAALPTVLSVTRRHLAGQPGGEGRLLELLEVGNQVLIEAIDAYDFARDRTFGSYLTFVLMRRLASDRPGPRRAHRRLSGAQALLRMQEEAGRSGVHLKVDPN